MNLDHSGAPTPAAALSGLTPSPPALRLARGWLLLGVAALIGSGLLAILLVLSRTPGVNQWLPVGDFFRAALVAHVDLSVLVWFMAFAGLLWSLAADARLLRWGQLALALALAGSAMMTAAPFFPDSQPLLNNYIPVLQHPLFLAGLLVAGAGFSLMIMRSLLLLRPSAAYDDASAMRFGVWLGALAGAAAAAAFALTWFLAPPYEGQAFYELLFWSGGHILQFQHTLLLLAVWLWLAQHLGCQATATPRTLALLFALAATPLAAAPVLYFIAPPGSDEHFAIFLRLMEWGHPLMLPLALLAAPALWRSRGRREAARSALLASFFLFAVGGLLAWLIRGANVVVPAHYHGSIVGVTLAFMGLTYVLLPRLGYGAVRGRAALWQPWVYGGGQLLHILGLAWSGGYGVQRKVAGAEQALTTLQQKLGMGLMGAGGLIAIIGGLMFVLICLGAIMRRPR